MRRRPTDLALCSLLGSACAREAPIPDRQAVVVVPSSVTDGPAGIAFDGEIRFANEGRITARTIGPDPVAPSRPGEPGTPIELTITSQGLGSLDAEIGVLSPRGAARQEVDHDTPGQPEDPRGTWTSVRLGEGEQRFELPPLGEDWHAANAIIVLELRAGGTWLPAVAGPRSEMVRGEQRFPGGRVVLGVVPVQRRPTSVGARRVEAGTIEVDGVLDEEVWASSATRLLTSRDGEPASETDGRVGGSTEVWFAWDPTNLYVAASLPDHDLFAEQRDQDDPIYRNEAFEVFVSADDSGSRYLEFQVSARGVTFDARFPRYRKGDEDWDGEWTSAVVLDGELERRGGDRGWTVEIAFPWSELCAHTAIRCPARADSALRVNVFRLEKPDREAQVGLALSPTLEPDFHAWANAAHLRLEP